MTRVYDIGIMLTIMLVAVSSMYTFINSYQHTGITPPAEYSEATIEHKLQALQLKESSEEAGDSSINTGIFVFDWVANAVVGAGNTIGTGLGYLSSVLSGLVNFGQLLFGMFTGWIAIIDGILVPVGLGGLALVIKAILGTIEFVTLFTLIKDVVIGLAGRFG